MSYRPKCPCGRFFKISKYAKNKCFFPTPDKNRLQCSEILKNRLRGHCRWLMYRNNSITNYNVFYIIWSLVWFPQWTAHVFNIYKKDCFIFENIQKTAESWVAFFLVYARLQQTFWLMSLTKTTNIMQTKPSQDLTRVESMTQLIWQLFLPFGFPLTSNVAVTHEQKVQ